MQKYIDLDWQYWMWQINITWSINRWLKKHDMDQVEK